MEGSVAKEFTDWVMRSQADDEKETFSEQFAQLNREYQDVSNDLERERVVARATQEEMKRLKHQFEDLQNSVDSSSFVLVLIDADGDGYIFKDEYYQTIDGGRQAALNFRESVRGYLKKEQPHLSSLPIVVKAFANGDGLSKLLAKANIIKPPLSLIDFAKGFSQAYDTCDFVLVGSGKDRADVKIKGVLDLFVRNPTCRHVIFGACHDNGYVRALEAYVQSASASRVTLLQSFDTGREFTSLKFPCFQMGEIFRAKPVTGGRSPPPLVPLLENSTNTTTTNGSGTWAAHLSTTGDSNNGGAISKKAGDLPVGAVLLNAAGQRVDTELPLAPQRAWNSWYSKTKKGNKRYCRAFQLQSGPCGCGKTEKNYCHEPLPEEERMVFRHELRRERCYSGLDCRDPNCFFGHGCPCVNGRCNFPPVMHNVDTTSITVYPGLVD